MVIACWQLFVKFWSLITSLFVFCEIKCYVLVAQNIFCMNGLSKLEKLSYDGMHLTNNTITLKLLLKGSDESLNAFPLQN